MSKPERIPTVEELVVEIRAGEFTAEQHEDWCRRIREAHLAEICWGTCSPVKQFVRVFVNENHTTLMDWFEVLRREFEFGIKTADEQQSWYKEPLKSKSEWEMLAAFVQDLAKRFPVDKEIQANETKSYSQVSQEKANRRVEALLTYIGTLGQDQSKVAKMVINGVQ